MEKCHSINDYNIVEYDKLNVFIIENILNYNFCDQLIKLIDSNNCKKLSFSEHNNVECFNVEHFDNEILRKQIIDKFTEIFQIFERLVNNQKVDMFSNFELRKVYGITRTHVDGTFGETIRHPIDNALIKTVRNVTCVIALNDNYDDGIYNFPNQQLYIKLKKGSAILFPPYWTHPHNVSKIGDGQYRYILSSWGLSNNIVIQEENIILNNIIMLKQNK